MSRFELMLRLIVVALTLFASLPIARVSANPNDLLRYQTEESIPFVGPAANTGLSHLTHSSGPVLTQTMPVSATEIITSSKTLFLPLITKSSPNPPVDVPTGRLVISKTGPVTAAVGAPITYTLWITNVGNAPATNLVITDDIPAGANYVSGGTAGADNTVSWIFPSLAGGVATQVSFVVTATTTITNSNYQVTASGGISATGLIPVVTAIQPSAEANFTADPQTGSLPLTVTFANRSTQATSYLWDFGDGITSTLVNPIHNYTGVGIYTVTLSAIGLTGPSRAASIITVTDEAISGLNITNDSPTMLAEPTTLTLTVTGGSNIVYTWDFGDGSHFTGPGSVVSHTYPAVGNYTVAVTTSNSLSVVTAATTLTITGETILAISNSAPISAVAGEPITYTLSVTNSGTLTATHLLITNILPAGAVYGQGGTRTGNMVSWTADSLPPGSSITAQFTVTATETITNSDYRVSGDDGVMAAGLEPVVTLIYPLVSVDFAANPLSGTAPLTVTFANSSTNSLMHFWDFGDTLSSTQVNPTHIYTQAGVYSVTLTSVGLSGSRFLLRPDYLTVHEPVVPEFFAAPSTGQMPLTVNFTNQSTGAVDYLWDFGDGITDTILSPSHTYTQTGSYTVTLTATGPGGQEVLTRTNYITVSEPLLAVFTAAPLSGTVPLTVTFVNSSTNAAGLLWDFGDGVTLTHTGTLTTPIVTLTHTYTRPGVYTVSLAASSGGLIELLTRPHLITAYAGISREWRVMTTTLSPSVRGEHSLAYDSTRERVILYGGNAGGWPYQEETWEFDGVNWYTITTPVSPAARYGAGLAPNNNIRGMI